MKMTNSLAHTDDGDVSLSSSSDDSPTIRPNVRAQQQGAWNRLPNPTKLALSEGQEWFLVDKRFLRKFQTFIEEDGNVCPDEISNAHLLQEPDSGKECSERARFVYDVYDKNTYNSNSCENPQVLLPDLRENVHYVLLSREHWSLLRQWYGGGPEIRRRVVRAARGLIVEIHPLLLYISTGGGSGMELPVSKTPVVVSRTMSVKGFRVLAADVAHKSLNVCVDKTFDLWLCNADKHDYLLQPEDTDTLEAIGVEDFSTFVFKESSLQIPQAGPRLSRSPSPEHQSSYMLSPNAGPRSSHSPSPVNRAGSIRSRRSGILGSESTGLSPGNGWESNDSSKNCMIAPGYGLKGLQNLGNTCFMNSALQCLSNTEELTQCFLGDGWKRDLNTTNPLGLKGQLAEEYIRLVRELWSGNDSYAVYPSDFKRVIARFAPQFTGYAQHDSQELLAFLLDGLHEDLNRILDKPLTEIPTGNGKNDVEIANLTWERHKLRNDSLVLSLFAGQYHSKLVCPDASCGNVSVTFDPYTSVTLQLPQATDVSIAVIFRFKDPSKRPVKYVLSVPKTGTVLNIFEKLEALTKVDKDCIVLADVISSHFSKFFHRNDRVWSKGLSKFDDDVYAYELHVPMAEPFDECGFRHSGYSNYLNSSRFSSMGTSSPPSNSSTAGIHPPSGGPEMEKGGNVIHLKVLMRKQRNTGFDRRHVCTGIPFVISVPAEVTYCQLRRTVCAAMHRFTKPTFPNSMSTKSSSRNDVHGSFQRRGVGGSSSIVGGTERVIDGRGLPFSSSPEDGLDSHMSGISDGPVDSSFPDESWGDTTMNGPDYRDPGHFYTDLSHAFVLRKLESIYREGDVIQDDADCAGLQDRGQISVDWTAEGVQEVFDAEEEGAVDDNFSTNIQGRQNGDDSLTLQDCLSAFITEETLSENDMWTCPQCKKHMRATKRIALWTVPKNLVIHLKRFSQQEGIYSCEKVDTMVSFPLEGLDMSDYVCNPELKHAPLLYDLYGVINHFGGSGFGHYTAYCRSPGDGQWHLFDDSSVSWVFHPPVVSTSNICLGRRQYTAACFVLTKWLC